jgi:hypothetical protein
MPSGDTHFPAQTFTPCFSRRGTVRLPGLRKKSAIGMLLFGALLPRS